MRFGPDGGIIYSPSDLIVFLEGDFASWMDRVRLEQTRGLVLDPAIADARPDERDPELELVAKLGDKHETLVLERLRREDGGVVEIDRKNASRERTRAAIRDASATIYQAHLADPPFEGYADFLRRSGNGGYEPWDSKLARSAKPYFLVQLCCYAEMLSREQASFPESIGIIFGPGAAVPELRYRTSDFVHYVRHLRRRFLAFQERFDPSAMPDPALERGLGRWSDFADRLLRQRDDLLLVAGITRSQVARLRTSGIETVAALSQAAPSRELRITGTVLERLRRQATLQIASCGLNRPAWEVIPPPEENAHRGLGGLPPAHRYDVYLDLEGFPLHLERFPLIRNGLEYLIGAVTVETGTPEFQDWWAHDTFEERKSFEQVIDWLHARWTQHPGLHIYHYAAYEKTAFRRLAATYATRETELDDLLRNEVLVDLYPIVRQGLVVGSESYSLKDVERLYRGKRQGAVTDAGGSIVAYQAWIDSGEPGDWKESPRLEKIRDYNRDDCISTWELAEWLRARQEEAGIPWSPIGAESAEQAPTETELERRATVEALERALLSRATAEPDAERKRITELLAYLLQYHRREGKPVWWDLFDRAAKSDDELYRDHTCIAGMERTDRPPFTIDRSLGYEYRFDPEQDLSLEEGNKGRFAHDPLGIKGIKGITGVTIEAIDPDVGMVLFKTTAKELPKRTAFLKFSHRKQHPIPDAVFRFVSRWAIGTLPERNAVVDLLTRAIPRQVDGRTGPLVADDAENFLAELTALVGRLDDTCLSIQGPPGTGKTWNIAHVILTLVGAGHRVGVTANSHAVIRNLMTKVAEHAARAGQPIRLVKVGDEEEIAAPPEHGIHVIASNEAAAASAEGPLVLGGTAWAFARAKMQEPAPLLDYLFVDEAGQVSLANLVGMGSAARNIVLIGDQMQLAQPVKGSHPGESGSSALEYALHGHATVPPDRGVLLPTTWRMHPEICAFISAAVYENRLHGAPVTAGRSLELPRGPLDRGTGIVMLDVEHEGNTQQSSEEIARIEAILAQLDEAVIHDEHGRRPFDPKQDVLIVAPYNLQVRRLQQALPDVRIGTVDKFQGQEAHVVIVSMCASSLEDASRGAAFLLNPNRLNVAISRAKCLAVVVGSPGLAITRCRSIDEMKLVNLYCHLRDYASGTLTQ